MISIVIITCNRKEELRKTILSCWRETADAEFIIVDNNSSDGTRPFIEQLAGEYSLNLKYFFQQENLGVAGGRNVGFRYAENEIVYFIDDDAVLDDNPGCINKIREFMSARPDIAIVATDIYNIKENYHQYGAFPKGVTPGTEGEVLYFIGASHFIKKSAFPGERLYPEKLFFQQEERYASFRAWGSGHKVWYTNTMRVIHNPSSFTRIDDRDSRLNNYLNSLIIKKLLAPRCLIPVVWMMFLLRFFRLSGLHTGLWKTAFSLYRERYDVADRRPMSLKKTTELIRKFGWRPIL